jgi:methylated-DNA-[protein]-cysteine S-methyltransferase
MATPFGALGIVSDGNTSVESNSCPRTFHRRAGHTIAEMALHQLGHYLADPDYRFDLPLAPGGSEFRRRIWAAIAAIPRGTTRTYTELAQTANSAARAVGQACGDNPFPLSSPATASSQPPGWADSPTTAADFLSTQNAGYCITKAYCELTEHRLCN